MREEQSIEIYGGDNTAEIAQFVADELKSVFCSTAEEFKDDWPGSNGKKYRVDIIVTPI